MAEETKAEGLRGAFCLSAEQSEALIAAVIGELGRRGLLVREAAGRRPLLAREAAAEMNLSERQVLKMVERKQLARVLGTSKVLVVGAAVELWQRGRACDAEAVREYLSQEIVESL